ncbi:hypothetical protein [Methanobrevibacter arboriphilus]|uniref:hypothetical protein n=1 Tax=Methanobrevibacter arboriphilus TaxID=39441 RepID=UPI000B204230|nr:hypothetical protein [Methanobrevibacter arboriphilus]
MPEYMYILSKYIHYQYNQKSTSVTIKYNVKNPSNPTGVTIKGSLTKAQYYSYSKKDNKIYKFQ